MPDPMTRRVLQRPWLARFVLLAFSLVIAVLAMEAFIRMTSVDRPLEWQPDPTLGWWHVPGARQHWTDEGDGRIEINSVGLRDRERQVARDPGVLRIAVFGDSMTEGVQVNLDQTFCQLLEERLSRRLGRPIEVLNFGVNGYSPLQEYLLYK